MPHCGYPLPRDEIARCIAWRQERFSTVMYKGIVGVPLRSDCHVARVAKIVPIRGRVLQFLQAPQVLPVPGISVGYLPWER